MYNLFCRYVYVLEFVAALLPRIALPVSETRAVVPARETTLRDAFATFDDVVRDTTLRAELPRDVVARPVVVAAVVRDAVALGRPDVVVVRDAVPLVVVVRDVVGTAVAVRDTTPRDIVAPLVFAAPRETTFDDVPRAVAVDGRAVDARTLPAARGDATVDDVVTVAVGAIGSANTARIDNKVEQTKNAPASKNTVPIAFLTCSAKLRLFINTLLYSGNARKTRCLMV